MKREFLKELELEGETIDKIMAEYGRSVQSYKEQVEDFKSQLENANNTIKSFEDMDIEGIKTELQTYKDKEVQRIAEEEARTKDLALTERIEKAFGESKFINDLTRKALISEMKTALNDESNVGKSDVDIFNSLTKDQPNIFVNPNQPVEIPPMGNIENETKETPIFW